MSSSNHTPPHEGPDDQRNEQDPESGRGSGEGAASALAHLKKQVRQHRHEAGEIGDRSEGPSS